MNITYRHFLLIFISFLLSACGQFGSLYLPGHGAGYYQNHPFTERPTDLPPQLTTTKKLTPNNTNSTSTV